MIAASDVSLLAAFGAGVLSFFSPCVVPLVPAYFAMLAALAAETRAVGVRYRHLAVWLAFFTGFTLTFSLLGLTASLIGRWLLQHQFVLQKAASMLFVFMGMLMVTGRAGSVLRERRWQGFAQRHGLAGAFFMGFSFSFGWTPCTGPVLASLLTYASLAQHWQQAFVLLGAYSFGLAMPFALLTIVGKKTLFQRPAFLQLLPWLQRVAGGVVILLGLLLWFDWINWLIGWLSF